MIESGGEHIFDFGRPFLAAVLRWNRGMASKSDHDVIEDLLKSTTELLDLVNKEQHLNDSEMRLIKTYALLLHSDVVELKTQTLLRKSCTY